MGIAANGREVRGRGGRRFWAVGKRERVGSRAWGWWLNGPEVTTALGAATVVASQFRLYGRTPDRWPQRLAKGLEGACLLRFRGRREGSLMVRARCKGGQFVVRYPTTVSDPWKTSRDDLSGSVRNGLDGRGRSSLNGSGHTRPG